MKKECIYIKDPTLLAIYPIDIEYRELEHENRIIMSIWFAKGSGKLTYDRLTEE